MVVNALLHLRQPQGPPWRFLPWVLALAFGVRAAVALSGDFMLHPDEIMQYLEPAHRLVFGNGIMPWEFFYGARSWLMPGFVAGILALLERIGLGEPVWYIPVVKLAFCAVSLLIPTGMYFFARRHFGETTARITLVASALWYELVAFAHKPMTEFVATALLSVLLALCVRPSLNRARTIWAVAVLVVLVTAIRLQYAPLSLLLLGVVFWRTRRKALLVTAAGLCLLAIGIFDGVTWDGALFHSYATNISFNRMVDQWRIPEAGTHHYYLWWLVLASSGLGVLCLSASLLSLRRYGFLLVLIALVLLPHTLQVHKEYRFVFAMIPLWLLMGSDLVRRILSRASRRSYRSWGLAIAVGFVALSTGGMLNALPYQSLAYQWGTNRGFVIQFVNQQDQDPIFAAYRHLSREPGVQAVLHDDLNYFSSPGYYYLHRKIPFYDINLRRMLIDRDRQPLQAFVSHVLSTDPDLSIPGFRLDQQFGALRILRREAETPEVHRWEQYVPIVIGPEAKIMQQINPAFPPSPPAWGIRFLH